MARRRSPSLLHSGIATVRGAKVDPRIAVDVSSEGVRAPLSSDRVREIVQRTLKRCKVNQAMMSVTFLSKRRMAALNKRHLGHSGATDVISFALGDTGPHRAIVGDIYVCPEVARANAKRYGSGTREELARLVVHGTLHVLGRTHPEGWHRTQSDMWKEQEDLLRYVG